MMVMREIEKERAGNVCAAKVADLAPAAARIVDLIGRLTYFAEISRRMYEEIRSSRDPRDHVEDG